MSANTHVHGPTCTAGAFTLHQARDALQRSGYRFDRKRGDWVNDQTGVRGRLSWQPACYKGRSICDYGVRFWLQPPATRPPTVSDRTPTLPAPVPIEVV